MGVRLIVLRAWLGARGGSAVVAGFGCAGVILVGRGYGYRRIGITRVAVRRARWLLLLRSWGDKSGCYSTVPAQPAAVMDNNWLMAAGVAFGFGLERRCVVPLLRLSNWSCLRRRPIVVRLRGMIMCRRRGLRRATDDQRVAIATELIAARAMSGRRGGVPDGDGTDGCVGDGGDVFRINPVVGQVVTVTVEIVDDRGLIENLRDLGRCRAIVAWMRIAKMLGRNKRETICAQTPVETDADCASAIKETDAGLVGCKRRQRCPAAVTTRIPPGHP